MAPSLFTSELQGPALIDAATGEVVSYAELRASIGRWRRHLDSPKALVFHLTKRNVESCASLLAAVEAGHAVALINGGLPSSALANLIALYHPHFVISSDAKVGDGTATVVFESRGTHLLRSEGERFTPHPELGILLSTSGSTGSPKFVRHRLGAIAHNARAIAETLEIGPGTVGFGHLELHYSYGLSVLTSHLAVGACVVLSEANVMQKEFWRAIRDHRVSHFPGVPFHYETMLRLGLNRLGVEGVSVMTQAGGRLRTDLQQAVHRHQDCHGGKFYVMYGQTEAAPRITTLPHGQFEAKLGSVGYALPGGTLSIEQAGNPVSPGESGEVVYRGPNVMMGYAEGGADVARGDELQGVLRTGDLGYLDGDGALYLTGRANRMTKVHGWRINLDEIEAAAGEGFAVIEADGKLVVCCERASESDPNSVLNHLSERFNLARHMYRLLEVDQIPRNASGKADYRALGSMAG